MRIPGHVLPLLGVAVVLPGAAAWAGAPLTASPGVQVRAASATSAAAAAAAKQLRGSEPVPEVAAAEPLAAWARGLLAAIAMVAVVAVGAPRAAHAEGTSVNVFFGQGCFWHVQHELVKKEGSALGRKGGEFTALSGYAGGLKAGDGNRVCYHNLAMAPDYGQLGHTEVVNVSVPESMVGEFAKDYFDAASKYPFGRADPQDRGTEYRSAIGIPGGMDGPLFKQVEAANNGRMELLAGKGNDADTVGTKKIWIYDSDKFPFYQGEVYHQFHDDMLERYSQQYHSLKNTLLEGGKISKVQCPELGF